MSLPFAALEQELKDAPPTWVPALLRALVQRAEEAKVFKEGGLMLFVSNALRRAP